MANGTVAATEKQLSYLRDLKQRALAETIILDHLPERANAGFARAVAYAVLTVAMPEPQSQAGASEQISFLRSPRASSAWFWFQQRDRARGQAIMSALADRYGNVGQDFPAYGGDAGTYAADLLKSIEAAL